MILFFKKNVRLFIFISSIAFTTIFISSCDTVNKVVKNVNVFPLSDDVSLGNQVASEIESNQKEYPIYKKNPAVVKYLNDNVFLELMKSGKIKNKDSFNYQMQVIDNDEILNAFALPGGKFYIYTGLLKYLDSEAAVAGVMGHEIAHAEERHATERMTKQYGVSMLLSVVLGDNPSQITQIASNLFVGAALLANSRSQEDESDQRSFEFLQDTKFYPGAVKFFFEKLRDDGKVNSAGSGLETFLSTHPDPIERIANTDSRLKAAGLLVYSYKDNQPNFFKESYKKNILDKI